MVWKKQKTASDPSASGSRLSPKWLVATYEAEIGRIEMWGRLEQKALWPPALKHKASSSNPSPTRNETKQNKRSQTVSCRFPVDGASFGVAYFEGFFFNGSVLGPFFI
jgi:hypothetical protein